MQKKISMATKETYFVQENLVSELGGTFIFYSQP